MNIIRPIVLLLLVISFFGCADREAAAKKAQEEAAAKARAEAARKEMETVPKVFRPQYHNKRLEPEKSATAQPTPESVPEKKP